MFISSGVMKSHMIKCSLTKGDFLHESRLTTKYEGSTYIDWDNPDWFGQFRKVNCAALTKCQKESVLRSERKSLVLCNSVILSGS
jgi:hypothetical protein